MLQIDQKIVVRELGNPGDKPIGSRVGEVECVPLVLRHERELAGRCQPRVRDNCRRARVELTWN